MRRILGRVLGTVQSLLAAVMTAAFCFVPAWAAHLGIGAGLVPFWVYGFVAGLVLVGAGVTLALLEKAWKGRGPLGR